MENNIQGETPKELMKNTIEQLEKDKLWCDEHRDNWAKLKSYDLPEKTIIFNLGLLAYAGAMSSNINIPGLLSFSISCSLLSLCMSYYIMWKVATKNIRSLFDRSAVLQETIQKIHQVKIEKNFQDAMAGYDAEMRNELNLMNGDTKNILFWQNFSHLLFLISVTSIIFGLLCISV